MPAVTWDLPSGGTVNDVDPCLKIQNTIGNAMQAKSTDTAIVADSVDASAIIGRANQSIAAQFYTPTSVGVFILTPQHSGVFAANQTDASATVLGLCGQDPADPNASGGIGTFGINNRPISIGAAGYSSGIRSVGVVGQADQGIGVRAIGQEYGTESFGLTNHGIRAITFGQQSAGVRAEGVNQSDGVRATATAGRAVAAHSQAGTAVEGVSDTAHGVTGDASNRYAVGVRGTNDHVDGIGVEALSRDGTALSAFSINGLAMKVESFAGDGLKVKTGLGTTVSVTKIGPDFAMKCLSGGSGLQIDAFGPSPLLVRRGLTKVSVSETHHNRGLEAFAPGTAVAGTTVFGRAIFGEGSSELGAFAGYFKGDVKVRGTLFKYVDCFMIDHPLDPQNQALVHAAVESDQYRNLYDGTARLDEQGEAEIELPAWFEALNADIRYQLTAVGGPAPDLHVATQVKDNRFRIAGGMPGSQVCWQITGVRADDWALDNPMQVEQPREPDDPDTGPETAEEWRALADRLEREAAEREQGFRDRLDAASNANRPEPEVAETESANTAVESDIPDLADKAFATVGKLSGDLEPGG